ncbi:phosphoserine phosphatase SerB [Zhihengliuella sp.]|uniref:phosphoserine phosphatase SerB n=1 Tax=Zhihengliuella sp. TaxID=1954483 RepID=UPI002812793B|nr:phosphoserine phosphatase SerB [Zhihengliuella sp.]
MSQSSQAVPTTAAAFEEAARTRASAVVVHLHPGPACAALTAERIVAALSACGTVLATAPVDSSAPEGAGDRAVALGGQRFAVEAADVAALRAAADDLLTAADVPSPRSWADRGRTGETLSVVPASVYAAPHKLLVMDVDSTLIQQEVIELLAAHAGREAEVAAVTEAAMRGELDFAQSLHARVEALAGLDASVIDAVRHTVRLSPGARDLVAAFRAAGHRVGVVSGGFIQILRPLADDLGLDFAVANELEISGGRLTGRVVGEVVDRAAKESCLRRWADESGVPLEATIAVGDGANDLDMVLASGLGVAYCAKPALATEAAARIDLPRLDAVLELTGVERPSAA